MTGRGKQTVDDADEAGGAGNRTGEVRPGVLALHLALGDQARDDEQREHRDRQVDEEDPSPRRKVGEYAGDDRAGRAAETGDAAPDAERLHPLVRVRGE